MVQKGTPGGPSRIGTHMLGARSTNAATPSRVILLLGFGPAKFVAIPRVSNRLASPDPGFNPSCA